MITWWGLTAVALCVLLYAVGSRGLERTPLTPAIFFTGAGLVLGPWLGVLDMRPTSSTVKALTEATLVLVLFSDASRVSFARLRGDASLPGRLLGIGLPLTIVAGTVAAAVVLPGITYGEALVLGTLLACTDAALGQAVVSDERVPARVRQGLNVESGLNDGLCVPVFFIALAFAETEGDGLSLREAWQLVAEEIGWGVVGGVTAGVVGAWLLRAALRRDLVDGAWLQILTCATAVLAAGIAGALGGSVFIAAFVGGLLFGAVRRGTGGEVAHLVDEAGQLLNALTFTLFGAAILGPTLGAFGWRTALYAVISLTVVRMVPVAVALLRSGAAWPTVAFVGWFGPRGIASIVFAVLLVEEASLPGEDVILLATILTIALSVLAHGATALPLVARYGRWYAAAHPGEGQTMEAQPVRPVPVRWAGRAPFASRDRP